MKLIIAASAARYTEHDEIVGLRANVEGVRQAASVMLGAIGPTGLLTVATPSEASHRTSARLIEESCTACAPIILSRMFPTIAERYLVTGGARVLRDRIEYELTPVGRRTMMG